uniref:Powdery mildew resistance protein PM3b, putative, expressed n=2 Tax=Oryza sativa subsp. japonica TaxID=39947 RepID=Q852D5_ORYSJ|nr:putative resistance complex protein [Oryza sativa Japonica Group]ABF99904.1 powdery mildew resistance protein PM3b, putative, expressed [Oryza sativa Japonica Group]
MVVGPLLSMVKDKASSYLLEQYKVMEGMEEQHEILKRKLPAILDVIADAEEQAAKHREGVKAWLEALRKVAYQANDVFDEFKYEALRRKAKGHYKKLGSMDVIKLIPTHNRFAFRRRMGDKLIKIVNEMEVLIAEMNAFRFEFRPEPPISSMKWRKTDCKISNLSMNIAIRSRSEDKQKIINTLLAQVSNRDLTVLPIVGMGGMGKTTLVQLIYNDPEIQKHFQLLLWVCVSDKFDVDLLAKGIVEAARKEKNENVMAKNSPQDALKEVLSGQRYLLVLDDVWNREASKWELLKSYLQHGGSGSSVLTTTRDQAVAQVMAPAQKAYDLKRLNESFIEEIIKTSAFSSEQERPPELLKMVGDIAKRCSGSPLAATALGSTLRTKTTEKEWESVLSRSMICDEENGILPILKLSYNCLPSYMRQCFAFCAIFPKDYEIDVEMLIQLWMANGFIPEQQGECPEIIGKRIFSELVSRSFFEDVKGIPFEFHHIKDSKITCKIHDLMHDVAQSSMGKECAAIATKLSKSEDFPSSARHLFLSGYRAEAILNTSLEKGHPGIQTLICSSQKEETFICDRSVNEDLQNLSKYRSVRALKIWGRSFLKPKYLHHLRYLDLSESKIKALPEDISILYHLQTLNLCRCYCLRGLPKGMRYLTTLRHLYLHGCSSLESMPPDLGRLICLQTLTCFVAGTCYGCSDLGELRQLDLGGQLELSQLENVTKADAKAANLRKKKKLTKLSLDWSPNHSKEAQNNHKEVLEGLTPNEGLKVLRIHCCGSSTCPTWMNKLWYMVELQLIGCKNLEMLPPLWQLPALEVLFLEGLDGLNCLFNSDEHTPFTFCKLKELTLSDMRNFMTWWDINEVQGEELVFPEVEKLFIEYCHRLTALPKASNAISKSSGRVSTVCRSAFPALKEMKLCDLSVFQRWEAVNETPREEVTFPQLDKLTIRCCPELTTLPEAPKLSDLNIYKGSQQLSLVAASRYITSMSSLNLDLSIDDTETALVAKQNSSELVYEKEKWNDNSPLELMDLDGCNLLFSHPSALALWACFVQLLDLTIWCVDVLDYWPEKVFQGLVSLRKLQIRECRNLTGHTQAYEQSTPVRSELLPCLESLEISYCISFVEMPNLSASLKLLEIMNCFGLKSIIFSQQHDRRLVSAESVTRPDRSSLIAGSSSGTNDHILPCLESLAIKRCDRLEVLHLPPSIKKLEILKCENLQSLSGKLDAVRALIIRSCESLKSLESCLGELPSLEQLDLFDCKSLVSLPEGPQAYSSLRFLTIDSCSGIELLPLSLQQRLDYLEEKKLDARYEGDNVTRLYVEL